MTLASDALAIARAGIAAVDPGRAVRGAIRVDAGRLSIGGRLLPARMTGPVHPVAFGKAAAAMLDAAATALGPRLGTGIAVVRSGNPVPRTPVELIESDHPVPTDRSVAAGRRLLEFVARLPGDEPTLFLVSGGASALVEVPAGSLTAADVARVNEALLDGGVPIQGMNTVRRHLSLVKGGRLGAATASNTFVTLAVSDVVGDAPQDVASGPTVGDPTSYQDALEVLARYHLARSVPYRVLRHLSAGAAGRIAPNPGPDDPRLRRGLFVFVATNRRALAASAVEARRRGYRSGILSSTLVGESREVGESFARRLRAAVPRGRAALPRCVLAGGETTVTLGTSPGRGGRNQEFALAGARVLAGRPFVHLLSVGTDGIDGPTDAAGGWTDGATLDRASLHNVDIDRALARHDAYPALKRLGELVVLGPTGTNVMDLHVGLNAPRGGRGGSSPPSAATSSRRRRS